jgi:hypothetical protein
MDPHPSRVQKKKLKLGLKFYLRYSVLFYKIFLPGWHQPKVSTPLPLPPKKYIGARPYGFKKLHTSKKLATVTRQLTKSIYFHQNYVCDSHRYTGREDNFHISQSRDGRTKGIERGKLKHSN